MRRLKIMRQNFLCHKKKLRSSRIELRYSAHCIQVYAAAFLSDAIHYHVVSARVPHPILDVYLLQIFSAVQSSNATLVIIINFSVHSTVGNFAFVSSRHSRCHFSVIFAVVRYPFELMFLYFVSNIRQSPVRTFKVHHPMKVLRKSVVKFIKLLIIFHCAQFAGLTNCTASPISAIFPLLASMRISRTFRFVLRD